MASQDHQAIDDRPRCVLVDRGSLTRVGLRSVLRDDGLDVEVRGVEPDDDVGATDLGDADVVVVQVGELGGSSVLRRLVAGAGDAPVVAVSPSTAPDTAAEAVRAGAVAVVAAQDAPRVLGEVVRAAHDGWSLVPSPLLHWFAQHTEGHAAVTDEELEWMRLLDRGSTIAQVARSVGYSERSLYRLLAGLYGRLGVSNRQDALAELRRRELL